VSKHRRHRPKTKELRNAEIAVTVHAVFKSRMIGKRYIGEISWGELTALSMDSAMDAAAFLEKGTVATETALLLHYLKQSCQVDDHARRIQEVVSPAQFLQAEKRARAMTPQVLELGKQRYISTVRNPEAIESNA
jgi:hypothetical protein